MTKVVTLLNQKGGVGKSTGTINLAAVRAEKLTTDPDPDASSPVAAVSIDPQGSALWWANRVDELPFHLIQAHDDPLDWLSQLNDLPGIDEVYVDTPGWFDLDPDSSGDGLGDGYSAEALRAVLDVTDEVLVPMLTQPMCFDPTARTIRKILEPRGLPYRVFINDWHARDGKKWLEETQKFVCKRGYPLAETAIRHYMIHTNASSEGMVVTQYPNDKVSQLAAQDYRNLADELDSAPVARRPADLVGAR
jgi:chromosome partitioning protein